jgi:hypothetical protein
MCGMVLDDRDFTLLRASRVVLSSGTAAAVPDGGTHRAVLAVRYPMRRGGVGQHHA